MPSPHFWFWSSPAIPVPVPAAPAVPAVPAAPSAAPSAPTAPAAPSEQAVTAPTSDEEASRKSAEDEGTANIYRFAGVMFAVFYTFYGTFYVFHK
ncbi:hypothetical protein COHA_001768 [Chlorella ohadii]|uniref:Uncharacterized protein n=1 Tax=Chlorella ohadii TaxID=2649997 RepID=A0AAD5E1P9_9CHLO|nr:hypothetical protein COHA_001768 [Chlorella ohadii]